MSFKPMQMWFGSEDTQLAGARGSDIAWALGSVPTEELKIKKQRKTRLARAREKLLLMTPFREILSFT